jgi:hypothetical protein
MALDEKILRANLQVLELYHPRQLRFVQFYIDGGPYLRLGTSSHPSIVESFFYECKRKKNQFVETTAFERAMQDNQGIPPLRIGIYEAVGFGFLNDTSSLNKIILTGLSSTYHLGPNEEHMQKLAAYFPAWTFEIAK